MSHLIDVSHVIEEGLVTYPGLPGPLVCDFLSREASRKHYAEGTTFQIGRIEMVANTGTYLDSPFHRYSHGRDVSQLPLEKLANLEAVVIHVDHSTGRATGPHLHWAMNWFEMRVDPSLSTRKPKPEPL